MTTKVTVEANHGWPVDVTNGDDGRKTRVPAGAKQDFYVYSGRDLLIHEVQPDEITQEQPAPQPDALL